MSPDSYLKFADRKLISVNENSTPSQKAFHIHSQLRSMVMSRHFPCSGAKTAFSQGTYRYGVFQKMGEQASTRELGSALKAFIKERPNLNIGYNTFIASFLEKPPGSSLEFTEMLWHQLQVLHDIDDAEWDSAVSSDPESPEFSFSFGGCSFFVIGLHACSPRYARRFAFPTLVFNPHDQFELLRKKGDFEKFKEIVRKHDFALQGSCNPILENHGLSSEAKQYSGEPLDSEWKCPFKHKAKKGD